MTMLSLKDLFAEGNTQNPIPRREQKCNMMEIRAYDNTTPFISTSW